MGRIIRHQEGIVPRRCRHCPRKMIVFIDDPRVLCSECSLRERMRQKVLARQQDDRWIDDPDFKDVF